jgi:hypothetical protein
MAIVLNCIEPLRDIIIIYVCDVKIVSLPQRVQNCDESIEMDIAPLR